MLTLYGCPCPLCAATARHAHVWRTPQNGGKQKSPCRHGRRFWHRCRIFSTAGGRTGRARVVPPPNCGVCFSLPCTGFCLHPSTGLWCLYPKTQRVGPWQAGIMGEQYRFAVGAADLGGNNVAQVELHGGIGGGARPWGAPRCNCAGRAIWTTWMIKRLLLS
jgi:hypothetical protein